jgi:membrane protein YqaA with SNARE-associated domain
MRSAAHALFAFLLHWGGAGLLVLGILDSSYLFAPWGNDLLLVALTARHRTVPYMLYYALMSTVGSVLGCLLIDLTLRPLGAAGLEKHLSARRLKQVKTRVEKSAGRALAAASLAPPPFPFTPFVMAAVALQYSRRRMLAVIGITRLVRFLVIGVLALRFGERILKWAGNPIVQGFLLALIVLCIVGSIVSVHGWIQRFRKSPAAQRT